MGNHLAKETERNNDRTVIRHASLRLLAIFSNSCEASGASRQRTAGITHDDARLTSHALTTVSQTVDPMAGS